jgi:hypothetical protein
VCACEQTDDTCVITALSVEPLDREQDFSTLAVGRFVPITVSRLAMTHQCLLAPMVMATAKIPWTVRIAIIDDAMEMEMEKMVHCPLNTTPEIIEFRSI